MRQAQRKNRQSTKTYSIASTSPKNALKVAEMVLGYMEGLNAEIDCLPKDLKTTAAYKHGWLNGRDDKLKTPRDKPEVLKRRAEMILGA